MVAQPFDFTYSCLWILWSNVQAGQDARIASNPVFQHPIVISRGQRRRELKLRLQIAGQKLTRQNCVFNRIQIKYLFFEDLKAGATWGTRRKLRVCPVQSVPGPIGEGKTWRRPCFLSDESAPGFL